MSYIQPANHIPFILKSETEIIKDAFRSLDATNGGIETYPICDYLLHSLFLRLTGAQEQKLKCICWEMACRDYEYRYERYERKPYGECSSYDDKCMVYNDLLNEIKNSTSRLLLLTPLKMEYLMTGKYLFNEYLKIVCWRKILRRAMVNIKCLLQMYVRVGL